MKKWIFILLALSNTLSAALPPLYQSLAEIKSLLSNPQLESMLGAEEAIEEIRKEDRSYIIKTFRKRMVVDIITLPSQHPGPTKFTFRFNRPSEID